MPPVPVAPNLGAKLLYRAATPLERAMADVEAERLIGTYAEIIIDQWDPYEISATNLPYLAWAMGVNLWEDDRWSEGTKRDWVARQWLFKSLRGTPAAIRMALEPSGYAVTDMVRPPQSFYASPELTKAEWDSWIRQMPQIRIRYSLREGTRGVDEFFLEPDPVVGSASAKVGFLDQDALPIDDGWVLYGREAVLRRGGVDMPLATVTYAAGTSLRTATDFERFSTAGLSSLGFFLDESATDDNRYLCFEEEEPQLLTVRLDRSYSHDASELALTAVTPGLDPLSPRYEVDSDVGDGGPFFFLNGDHLDDRFLDIADGGARLLADRLYLLDPDVTAPMMQGISFLDEARLGMPTFTAEVQIDLHTSDPEYIAFLDDMGIDHGYLGEEDPSDRDRAMRAVLAAKALRDTVLLSFAPKRPVEMGDRLGAGAQYDDWIADPL